MEQNKKNPATVDYVAEMMAKLEIAFYETPEKLLDALAKTIIFHEFTEREVSDMVWDAIYTIKKTKLTIADVINGREKKEFIYV